MREILFRGKSDLLGWIEGWYCPEVKWGEHHFPVGITHKTKEGWLEDVVVIPETIGQFTGLTDKNGKKIFEGDILKRTNGNKYVWYVDYKNCAFCANQSNCNYACELGELLDQIELEVIGNIHDNPELLENP